MMRSGQRKSRKGSFALIGGAPVAAAGISPLSACGENLWRTGREISAVGKPVPFRVAARTVFLCERRARQTRGGARMIDRLCQLRGFREGQGEGNVKPAAGEGTAPPNIDRIRRAAGGQDCAKGQWGRDQRRKRGISDELAVAFRDRPGPRREWGPGSQIVASGGRSMSPARRAWLAVRGPPPTLRQRAPNSRGGASEGAPSQACSSGLGKHRPPMASAAPDAGSACPVADQLGRAGLPRRHGTEEGPIAPRPRDPG